MRGKNIYYHQSWISKHWLLKTEICDDTRLYTFYNDTFILQRILSEVQAAPSPRPSPEGSPQLTRRKLAHTVSLPVESFGRYLSTMGIHAQSKDIVENKDVKKPVHKINYSLPSLRSKFSWLFPQLNLFKISCEHLVAHEDDILKLMIFNILVTHLLDNI